MDEGDQRILVIGRSSPLLEGVADLLQLAGYQVEISSSWPETTLAPVNTPPNLAIVDLSSSNSDAFGVTEQIPTSSQWEDVPVLFLSFAGDERVRDLQHRTRKSHSRRFQYYAHSVLGMEDLVNKVGSFLA